MRMISPWEYNYNDRCEAARLKILIVTLPVEIIAFIQRNEVIELLSISNPTAGNMLDSFCEDGIQVDLAPQKSRNKLYVFAEYVAILNKGTELEVTRLLIYEEKL